MKTATEGSECEHDWAHYRGYRDRCRKCGIWRFLPRPEERDTKEVSE